MIQAIIFDCFGVLTTEAWHAFLDSLSPDIRLAAQDVRRAYGAGMISKADMFKQVHDITGQDFIDPEDGGMVQKNELLLSYIRELKKTYKIGLLSNIGSNWIRDGFLNADEQNMFDSMVFSYEEGMNKPAARIFEIAYERLAVKPEEAIMVDDQPPYCDAARAIGMQAVVYSDFRQFKAELEQILSHV